MTNRIEKEFRDDKKEDLLNEGEESPGFILESFFTDEGEEVVVVKNYGEALSRQRISFIV